MHVFDRRFEALESKDQCWLKPIAFRTRPMTPIRRCSMYNTLITRTGYHCILIKAEELAAKLTGRNGSQRWSQKTQGWDSVGGISRFYTPCR